MADFEDSGALVDVRAAVRRQGGSLRSPLYQWMDRNHDELLALFRQAPPRWERVTAVLAGRGFCGSDGRPLRPQSVRRLSYRVRRRHGGS